MNARAVAVAVGVVACDAPAKPRAPDGASAARGVLFVPAPAGDDLPSIIVAARADAARAGRKLLVYEGATWCEPCKQFHAAAERGDLDAALPGVTLLELDADRDNARLVAAGYTSQLVPLFARPAPDGTNSGLQTSGARVGSDYVADLVPRVSALLTDAP